jgi:hypothetical protein
MFHNSHIPRILYTLNRIKPIELQKDGNTIGMKPSAIRQNMPESTVAFLYDDGCLLELMTSQNSQPTHGLDPLH